MISFRSLLSTIVAIALLSGCATNGDAAIAQGNLDLGERQATIAAQQGHSSGYNNLGVIAQRRGNNALAVQMYTIAARMGDPTAPLNLINLNQQVPAADMARAPGPDPWQALAVAAPAQPAYTPASAVGRPLPAIPPLGTKKCASRAIVENGVTRWVQVCD